MSDERSAETYKLRDNDGKLHDVLELVTIKDGCVTGSNGTLRASAVMGFVNDRHLLNVLVEEIKSIASRHKGQGIARALIEAGAVEAKRRF